MLTEDFSLPSNGDWLVIPKTSTQTSLSNTSGVDIFVRIGASSSSGGFIIQPSNMVVVDESLYARARFVSTNTPTVVVTR